MANHKNMVPLVAALPPPSIEEQNRRRAAAMRSANRQGRRGRPRNYFGLVPPPYGAGAQNSKAL